jgi:hypothetical protein
MDNIFSCTVLSFIKHLNLYPRSIICFIFIKPILKIEHKPTNLAVNLVLVTLIDFLIFTIFIILAFLTGVCFSHVCKGQHCLNKILSKLYKRMISNHNLYVIYVLVSDEVSQPIARLIWIIGTF